MSKSVEHIISNLNKEIVTFSSYDFITKEVKSTTMTLESRLKATCEESFLVSGEWLAANEARFDVDDIEIEDDGIYCVSTECIYDLSSDYAKLTICCLKMVMFRNYLIHNFVKSGKQIIGKR